MNSFHSGNGSDIHEDVTDEMVAELLSGDQFDIPENEEDEEIISTPEGEEGGWYDMKALVDYDETTTDEDVEMMTDNTGEDRLSRSDIPGEPMTPAQKAVDRWEVDGGMLPEIN